MTLLKVSITSQQKFRLAVLKEVTGLSFAELTRRALDCYTDKLEATPPIA